LVRGERIELSKFCV